ncbi:hypothetical protein D9M71_331820 [compost metagenome]
MLPTRLDGGPTATFQQSLEPQDQVAQAYQQHVQGQPRQTVMLAEVQQLAFDLQGLQLSAVHVQFVDRLGTLATDMHHRRVGVVDYLPARLLDAPAVIHFLVVEEIARIEQADLVDHFTADQVIATRHPVALAHRGMIPGQVVDQFHPREKALKPGSHEEDIERRREITAGGLHLAVPADQAHTEDPAIGMGLHVLQGLGQGVVGHKRVGVEQQRVLALQVFNQLIIGPAKADIVFIGQQHGLWTNIAQAIQRVVRRSVVHHQVACVVGTLGLAQRIEHGLQQTRRVVVDDEHIQGRATHWLSRQRSTAPSWP